MKARYQASVLWVFLSVVSTAGITGCGGSGPAIGLTVTASPSTVAAGTSGSLTATVANDKTNRGVTWAVSCSASSCGSVSPSASLSGASTSYIAPTTPPASDFKVTATATSVADPSKSQSAVITIPAITVSVSPATVTVLTNATQQFMQTVNNDSTGGFVNWTLTQTGTACSPGCGTVSPTSTGSGQATVYTPPTVVPANPMVTLTATSATDNTKSASATITVMLPPVLVTVAPTSAFAVINKTAKITATVQYDPANKGVAWTLTQSGSACSPACGKVTPNTASGSPATFTAPASLPANPTVTMTATSVSDNSKSATVLITIYPVAPNPVPFVNQPLVPEAVASGGAAFPLTVDGTGFVASSVVNWNGSARTTTFVNSSQIKASISATDIAAAGTATITVSSPTLGGGTSDAIPFVHAFSSSTVAFQTSQVTAGSSPSAVFVADFNGDLKPDLAVTNSNDNTVSIFLGNGDGTFAAPVNYTTGTHPFSIAAGDFNGDGKLDLVVANVGDVTVSVFLGNGDGTFKTGVTYQAGNAARSVVVADFNGDGKLDLAVANQGAGVSILLGNGDGTFQTASNYLTADGPTWMTTGDFNGDGFLDLAVTAGGGGSGNQVSILLGNGDGTFQTAVNYTTDTNPAGIAAADFNKDGKLDLAVANNSRSLTILLGNGDGTFQAAVKYPTAGPSIGSLGVADLNGDGNLDLIVANGENNVSVFLGNGDGTFQKPLTLGTGSGSFGVAVGDFNQDGRLDLAVADGGGTDVTIALQVATISLSSSSLNLGGQLVGTTSALESVTVTDDGPGSVNIASIALSGTNAADFAETNNCGSSLASAAAQCTINVKFTPSETGAEVATLTITDSAGNSPQTVNLMGAGLVTGPNATFSTSSLTFKTQLVGTPSTAQAVTLTNYGTTALTISNITASANFGETNNCPASLASVASCTISVTFTPTTAGTLNGTLSITDNAPATPQVINLTGVGTFVELNPSTLNFGSVAVNFTHTLSTTLTNTGSSTLTINSITTAGSTAFSQTNNCGGSVAQAGSCTITVKFHPLSAASYSGSVNIADSDAGSPQQVSLTGRTFKVRFNAEASRPALSAQKKMSVPTPSGSEHVGTREMDLVDPARQDPYLANGTKRELLVRFWYPTTAHAGCQLADYTPPAVWQRFELLIGVPLPEVKTNSCLNAAITDGLHPVVVFTHGYTGTFTDYTFLYEDLASRGYVVAAVDHTYEATAVAFPDGRVAISRLGSHLNDSWHADDATLQFAVSVRLDDLRFVLNQLEQMNNDSGGPFAGRLDISRVALAGHSLGGQTALLGVQMDSRFHAGVLIDPYLPEDVSMPTPTPILLLGEGRTAWSANELSLWSNLQGARLAVNFLGAEHAAPSDALWLATGAVQTGEMSEEQTLGAIRNYLAAFLDANLRGKPADPLLIGPSPEYPGAVVTTRSQALKSEQ